MRMTSVPGAIALCFLCGAAQADGLADLKGALVRLQGTAPLKATLDSKTWRRVGEGKEMEEYTGTASVGLEYGAQGLQIHYGKDMLARMEAEELTTAKNPNAKTPTIYAAREFSPVELRPMISAAASLAHQLERAAYKGEKATVYYGKPARQVSFSVPVDTLSDRQRKYIKEFNGSLEVWITADGTPLASRLLLNGSGRAFVVVGFDFKSDEQNVYMLAGDRLLTVRKESKSSSSGAGEKSEDKVVKTLQAG